MMVEGIIPKEGQPETPATASELEDYRTASELCAQQRPALAAAAQPEAVKHPAVAAETIPADLPEDGYKTPNEVEAALGQAPTDGAVRPEIGVTPPPSATAETPADLPPPQHNDADTGGTAAPSPDIESSICPANIGTAACITTAIIGVVAIAAASM